MTVSVKHRTMPRSSDLRQSIGLALFLTILSPVFATAQGLPSEQPPLGANGLSAAALSHLDLTSTEAHIQADNSSPVDIHIDGTLSGATTTIGNPLNVSGCVNALGSLYARQTSANIASVVASTQNINLVSGTGQFVNFGLIQAMDSGQGE